MYGKLASVLSFVCAFALATAVAAAESSTLYYPTSSEPPEILKAGGFGQVTVSPQAEDRWMCGIRIEAKSGEAVYAVADGQVAKISPYGWGKNSFGLIVRHSSADGRSFIAVYGCVRKYVDGRVKAGQKIAVVGNSGYLHFGIFDSADGGGAMPYVRSQADYAMPFLPRPPAEIIDGVLCYGRWFDPIEYLRKKAPEPASEDKGTAAPSGAPGSPILDEPVDGSEWSAASVNSGMRLGLRGCSGPKPTAYRFRVRRITNTWYVVGWRDWVSEWITVTPTGEVIVTTTTLPPGDYWWEAQAKNSFGEGRWLAAGRRFHINCPPRTPVPQSPGDGHAINTRRVTLSWSDGGDPDDFGRHHGEYRVVVGGDWSYDSGWIRSTSQDISIPKDGHFTWRVAARDRWDQSGYSATCKFTVDTAPPDIVLNGPEVNRWTRSDSLAWSVSDANSGLDRVTMQWDSRAESTIAARGSARIPEGRHTVAIRAVDRAGNSVTASRGEFRVDVTPPTLTVSLNPPSPDGSTGNYVKSCTISASASDTGGSGIDGIFCRMLDRGERRYEQPLLLTSAGPHRYFIKAVDMAGNESLTREGLVTIERPQVIRMGPYANPPSPPVGAPPAVTTIPPKDASATPEPAVSPAPPATNNPNQPPEQNTSVEGSRRVTDDPQPAPSPVPPAAPPPAQRPRSDHPQGSW